MKQVRDFDRVVMQEFYNEKEGINTTYNYSLAYGNVNEVTQKTILYNDLYFKTYIVKVEGVSKDYYPLFPNYFFKPQAFDRLLLFNVENNKFYGYYACIDTMNFSEHNSANISGVFDNIVRVFDSLKNEPTILEHQQIVRGFYDNYLKFADGFIQLLNGVENLDVDNQEGLDRVSASGSTLLLSKSSIDKQIQNLELLKSGLEVNFYDRKEEEDDARFEDFEYSDGNKPTEFNLKHDDSGAVLIGDSVRIISPKGNAYIQNAVLGQNLTELLTNVTIYLQSLNTYLATLHDYVDQVKLKQEKDMQAINTWITATYKTHFHPQLGAPPNMLQGVTESTKVKVIEKFDTDNKSLFGTIRDKIYSILSKVIGIN